MLSGAKILVIEDDLPMLQAIRDVLELANYRVLTATNGLDALAILQRETPDLIVSDIMMPRMDGLRFCQQVRQDPRWSALGFIFLTAKSQKADIRQGMTSGADDYLTKPFEMDELLAAVAARLQRSAAIKARTEQQLADLRDNILRTLGHELRTPLTFVKGYSELLTESAAEITPEELQTFLSAIRTGSDRLSSLVDDLTFIINLETGASKAAYEQEKAQVDITPFLRGVIASFREKVASRNVTLSDRLADRLPPIICHRDMVTDAFRRLVENALKFAKKEGGRILVSSYATDHDVRVRIEDNGVGIPAAELPYLFEKFHQVNREKMEQQGAGLGLPIVKGIMEIHGGHIEVESKLGEGSAFTLVFPLLHHSQVRIAFKSKGTFREKGKAARWPRFCSASQPWSR